MRAAVALPFIGLLATADVSAQPALPTAHAVIAGIQARYGAAQTFEADVEEKLWVKAYNKETTKKGAIAIQRPADVELNFGVDGRVVSSGRWIAMHDVANKSAVVGDTPATYASLVAFFLGMPAGLQYQVFSAGAASARGVILVATAPPPIFGKVFYYVDVGTWDVARVLFIDAQGNRDRFDFRNARVGNAIGASRFAFPRGVTLLPM